MNRRVTGLVLGPLLFLIVMFSPFFPGLGVAPRRTLASALLIATWWITESIPIAVTSLLPIVLFPLLGILPSGNVAPNYSNHLVFLFLGGFIIAAGIEASGLHRRIALNTISRLGWNLPLLILSFMLSTAFLSMWVSNTATVLMMLPIAVAVLSQMESSLEKKTHSSLGATLMLAIAYSASIGGVGTLIGTPPNIVFSGLAKTLLPDHPEITFTSWMMIGVPVVVVLLPVVWLYLTRYGGGKNLFGIKLPPEARESILSEVHKLGPMDKRERAVSIIFFLTALLWITRRSVTLGAFTIPGWSQLLPWSDYVHDSTVAIAMATLLFLIRIEGKPLLNWKDTERRIPWGVLLLFGGGFALADAFQNSGLSVWFGEHLKGLGSLPILLLIFSLVLMMDLLTEVTSNTAITATMLPVVAATAIAIGKDPMLLMIAATLGASCAFALPVATPPNAIVFASGHITIQRMVKVGLFVDILAAILITLLVCLIV